MKKKEKKKKTDIDRIDFIVGYIFTLCFVAPIMFFMSGCLGSSYETPGGHLVGPGVVSDSSIAFTIAEGMEVMSKIIFIITLIVNYFITKFIIHLLK